MAEIPIERKENRGWLPWILGLLVLLLLAYCFTRSRGARPADTTAGRPDATATTVAGGTGTAMAGGTTAGAASDTAAGTGGAAGAAANGGRAGAAVDAFAQFVAARDTSRETETQHQYTAEGTRRLAAALDAIAGGNPNIAAYADSMRRSIDRLQQTSRQDMHADDAKAAFSAAVSAMTAIDRTRGGARDVAPMRAIYNQLDSKRLLMPQLPTVDRFFRAANDALQAMH